MMPLCRIRLLYRLPLWLCAFSPQPASCRPRDDIESKHINFPTFDEVELSGSFYRSAPVGKKDKDAVVLLLHDFRHNKGGGSQEDGWRQLAGQLQKEGYAVLSFDFRGFGNSKSVSPKFWLHQHNKAGIRARKGTHSSRLDQSERFLGSVLHQPGQRHCRCSGLSRCPQ